MRFHEINLHVRAFNEAWNHRVENIRSYDVCFLISVYRTDSKFPQPSQNNSRFCLPIFQSFAWILALLACIQSHRSYHHVQWLFHFSFHYETLSQNTSLHPVKLDFWYRKTRTQHLKHKEFSLIFYFVLCWTHLSLLCNFVSLIYLEILVAATSRNMPHNSIETIFQEKELSHVLQGQTKEIEKRCSWLECRVRTEIRKYSLLSRSLYSRFLFLPNSFTKKLQKLKRAFIQKLIERYD